MPESAHLPLSTSCRRPSFEYQQRQGWTNENARLASSQTQEVFYHDCSWSITTAVAMIAVIIALMKRHQREAAGNAMNNGTLVWREGRGS